MNLFKSLAQAFKRERMSDYERYISKARDVYELERMEKAWSRGKRV